MADAVDFILVRKLSNLERGRLRNRLTQHDIGVDRRRVSIAHFLVEGDHTKFLQHPQYDVEPLFTSQRAGKAQTG